MKVLSVSVLLCAPAGTAARYANVDVCEVARQQRGEAYRQDVPAHFKLEVELADVCHLLPGCQSQSPSPQLLS